MESSDRFFRVQVARYPERVEGHRQPRLKIHLHIVRLDLQQLQDQALATRKIRCL
jgi:hypothetical protein